MSFITDVLYRPDTSGGMHEAHYNPYGQYPFGSWRDGQGGLIPDITRPEDGVWPTELQDQECYTRAGTGDLGKGGIDDPRAEHKRSDFCDLRDFNLDEDYLLSDLSRCYKYWIALTDCDGFRVDTLKHVTSEQARNFCGAIKEFAANLGKQNLFIVGEIAGGDYFQHFYLDALKHNLTAVLDIGEMCPVLNDVAKGLRSPRDYFAGFKPGQNGMGSHRNVGERHVSILDDHDHVYSKKIRFSSEATCDHQVIVGVAMQLFTLGIPCIYYGTAGHHCFHENDPLYRRIAAATALRSQHPALRCGRQYLRCISFLNKPFDFYGPGEIVAWSRILDDEELLCIVNSNGNESRGADIIVDASLNSGGTCTMTVMLNTAQAAENGEFSGSHPVGSTVPVNRTAEGRAFVQIRDIPPAEVLVLANHP